MKKFFVLSGLMMAAIVSLTNCKKESQTEFVRSEDFKLVLSAPDTKTSNAEMSTLWSEKDAVGVFYRDLDGALKSLGSFTISDGAGTSSATFLPDTDEYTKLDPAAKYDWYVLYPYNKSVSTPASVDADGGYMYVGRRTGLKQDSYDSMAQLSGSNCALYAVRTQAAFPEIGTVPVKHLTSVVEFDVRNDTGGTLVINSLSLKASETIAGSYYIDITGNEPAYVESGDQYVTSEVSLSVEKPAELAAGAIAKFYMPIKPYTQSAAAAFAVTVNGTVDGKAGSVELTYAPAGDQAVFAPGKIKRVAVAVKGFGVSSTSTIAEVLAAPVGEKYVVENAVVVFSDGKNFLVNDQTGTILVFKNGAGLTVGQKVSISGNTKAFNNLVEFDNPDITDAGTGSVSLTAQTWTADQMLAAYGEAKNEYVKFTTEMSSSRNGIIKDGQDVILYVYPGTSVSLEAGKTYDLEGFVYGWTDFTNKTTGAVTKEVLMYVTDAQEAGGVTPPVTGETTLKVNITEFVAENKLTVSSSNTVTLYPILDLSSAVRMSTSGTPNCGAFYGTSPTEWRLYQKANGDVTITVASGCQLKSVKFTYTTTNTGSLFNGQTEVKSDEVVETSGTEVTFTVGNTGEAENGQVRIKEVEVVYTGSGTLPPADMPDTQTSITAPSAITVYLGETAALNASSNVNATITYESEDTAVATVDGNGVVTGHALGTTKVWARIAAVPGDYTAAEHYTTVTVAEKPVAGDGTWVETALGNIADGAQFVVVSTNAEGASYAMSNDNGTGAAPSAVAVTVASGKLSSAPASNLVWKMEKTQAGYVFHKDDETWLYATDTNNGLRVGKGAANEVVVEAETGYMTLTIQKETGNVTRYIGVYNKADWRCYTSINNNIKDQAFTYFVKQ